MKARKASIKMEARKKRKRIKKGKHVKKGRQIKREDTICTSVINIWELVQFSFATGKTELDTRTNIIQDVTNQPSNNLIENVRKQFADKKKKLLGLKVISTNFQSRMGHSSTSNLPQHKFPTPVLKHHTKTPRKDFAQLCLISWSFSKYFALSEVKYLFFSYSIFMNL